MTRCPGPLELLHPDGLARRAVVLGGACPARLRPGAPEGEPKWDLVVIAPTAAEARSRDWVADSVRRTVGGLADDGLAYVLGAAGARRRIAGALEREGLRTSGRFAHLPDIASSELIVPLRPRAARAATGRLERPYARQLARAALAVPGAAALIGRCGDPIGIVARRHAARPLAMWLGAAPDAEGIGSIRTRWRADRVRTLVHLISGEGAFVKLASGAGGEGAVRRECAALARLGAAARASGARIPESELIGDREACPALRLGMVPGVPARAILARSPSRRDEILAAVGRWLEAWSRGTRRVARL
ncbi:MAG TPA: hypothetical protein VEB59_00815, partial [Gemmatimonadales bacterium]|nr:hypothetical protein [Gemmatimonadales bacterium]